MIEPIRGKQFFSSYKKNVMDNNGKIALAFAAGVIAGAIAGVLFAPDKGSETRRKFSEKGRKMADDLKEKWKDAKAGFESEFQK